MTLKELLELCSKYHMDEDTEIMIYDNNLFWEVNDDFVIDAKDRIVLEKKDYDNIRSRTSRDN